MSSHRGKKRGKTPQRRAREARRASFDLYLPRLLRGDLTPAEAALLAEYIREEVRVSDETHANLKATSRALDSIRGATDTAVQEAEQLAKEAEARAATLEAHPQFVMELGAPGRPDPAPEAQADRPTMVLHTVARPAAAPGADEMRRQGLAYALGAAPGTPWPTLLLQAHEAHQWARRARSSAREADQLKVELTDSTRAREDLGRRLVEAQEHKREAMAEALRLRSQTPVAAVRTLDSIRSASSIGEVCTHLGMFYGMSPGTAGEMARRWRAEAEQGAAEGRVAIARALRVGAHFSWEQLAVVAERTVSAHGAWQVKAQSAEHRAGRYRAAWESARERGRKKEAARAMAMARMEHAANQAARQAVELEDAARDRRTLAQWEATYGTRALRDTQARLRTVKDAMARLRALRADSGRIAEMTVGPTWMETWGPTWKALWEVLGDAVNDPTLTTAAVRCVPVTAKEGHPVHALLRALNEGKRSTEAQRLVRDFYEAIHGACCPLDHGPLRPGAAAEAARWLLDNQMRRAFSPLAVGR
ncbi:hypothetical protein AB0H51_28015 [Streptomyces griseoluteus]|uniref:hypothetical protein n=1 Tax=Streptomyces griseoluteus TaxID=29306 RepID=UPI0033E02644